MKNRELIGWKSVVREIEQTGERGKSERCVGKILNAAIKLDSITELCVWESTSQSPHSGYYTTVSAAWEQSKVNMCVSVCVSKRVRPPPYNFKGVLGPRTWEQEILIKYKKDVQSYRHGTFKWEGTSTSHSHSPYTLSTLNVELFFMVRVWLHGCIQSVLQHAMIC